MNTKRLSVLLLVSFLLAVLSGISVGYAQGEDPAQQLPSEPDDVPADDLIIPPDAAPNNTPATAFPIECGQTLGKHVTAANEVDWYKFTTLPGIPFTAFVEAAEIGYGGVDASLTLYSNNATTVLASNADYDGKDPRLHWVSKGANSVFLNTYYLKVEDLDDDSLGYYTLSLDRANYFSFSTNLIIGGVAYQAGDVLAYYQCKEPDKWAMFLDMSDVGVSADTTGFAMLPGNDFLMSFKGKAAVPPFGSVPPQDLVHFNATDIGNDTAGTFTKFLDGSDVGINTAGESIDAVAVSPAGKVVISTKGNGDVPGLGPIKDEDLLRFTATQFGANSSGTWDMHFDGSDEGLGPADLISFWHEPLSILNLNEDLYMTFDAAVVAGGKSIDGGDVAQCLINTLGWNTDCTFWTIHIDASDIFGWNKVDAHDRGGVTDLLNYP